MTCPTGAWEDGKSGSESAVVHSIRHVAERLPCAGSPLGTGDKAMNKMSKISTFMD